jgi:hypothetical protein
MLLADAIETPAWLQGGAVGVPMAVADERLRVANQQKKIRTKS